LPQGIQTNIMLAWRKLLTPTQQSTLKHRFGTVRAFGTTGIKWLVLVTPIAAAVGSACAIFVWALEQVTHMRFDHPALLFLLPFAGVGISVLYNRWGRSVESGNNLLLDAIQQHPTGDSAIIIPRRMAPLILVSTIITHLFGGSAGREGTAVQLGGAIAATIGRVLRLGKTEMRIMLLAGIAAGFGGVFGTPLAGTVFALEVLTGGSVNHQALIPCLLAALGSDWVARAWGVQHTHYIITNSLPHDLGLDWLLAGKVAIAALAFGLTSTLFAELTHAINRAYKRWITTPYLRPFLGGLGVIALVYLFGTRDYLGLGTSSPDPQAVTILAAFRPQGVQNWSWLLKLIFTALTLGSGFKGGEVTPLFFIGASLGQVLARLLAAPVDLFAGLGFVAVFAGATNTPLACTLMAIELFGAQYTPYFALACFLAYWFSGHSSIYHAQRLPNKMSGL
jgi:H+/Cl- antiporter ClcA